MSDSSKQSVYVRFEKETHQRLQKLSQQSGDSTTKLVRMLVERALEHDMSVEYWLVRKQLQAVSVRWSTARQGVANPARTPRRTRETGLQGRCQRRRRSELDHAKQRNFWCSSRYGIWELQTVIVHALEYALLTDGHGREVSRKLHADCQDASSVSFKEILAAIDAECAEIDAGAPAAIQQHRGRTRAGDVDPPGADELTSWLAAIGGDEPKALAALRRLLTEPASPMTPQPGRAQGKANRTKRWGPTSQACSKRQTAQRQSHRPGASAPPTTIGNIRMGARQVVARWCHDRRNRPPDPSQRRFQPRPRRPFVPQPEHGCRPHVLRPHGGHAVAVFEPRRRHRVAQPRAISASRSSVVWASFLLEIVGRDSANGRCGRATCSKNGPPSAILAEPYFVNLAKLRSAAPCCGAAWSPPA